MVSIFSLNYHLYLCCNDCAMIPAESDYYCQDSSTKIKNRNAMQLNHWERAAANPSAVNPVQWLWLESCCWCSEDQEMTFGKTLQWRVFLWRTDRRPCQQPLEAVSFPSKNIDNGCPLRCLSITLSKHWVSKPTHSGRVPANGIFPQFQMASIVSSMDTVCNVLSLKWG